ncbi:unnamed protein product, partial [Medioppia subpectinata]
TPLSVKDEPTVQWPTEEGAYYTFIMTDPDAGARAEFKHWHVVDIPGNDLSAGETLAHFMGSAPPAADAPHRYVFLVYKQPSGRLNHSETPSPKEGFDGRPYFKVREFAKKYNLGEPYAGNIYLAKGDAHSAQIRAGWGIPA